MNKNTNKTQGPTPPEAGHESKMTREQIAHAITCELESAYTKHGKDQWGRHEFYAILLEEVEELWEAIKRDEPRGRVRSEAVQVAAMVFRYLETGDRYEGDS